MAEIKTKVTQESVSAFLKKVPDEEKRKDAIALAKIFKDATKMNPKMWGTSIVGYGSYHYKSERSKQEGEWPLVGFSPRKQNLTMYIMPGFKEYGTLLQELGKHTTSVGCLYIKRLSDVDTNVLKALIQGSFSDMKKKYSLYQ